MRKITIKGLGSLAIALTCAMLAMLGGGSVHAASASAQASATVIAPVVIARVSDLEIRAPASAPAPANWVTMMGEGRALRASATPVSVATESTPATFTITSDSEVAYNLSVPSPISVTEVGGERTLAVAADVGTERAGILSYAGTQTVRVGGTLLASVSPASGSYEGSFSIVLEYN